MNNRITLIALAVIILLIGTVVNFENIFTKEYSIKDVKEGIFKDNRTNEKFVSIKLPDETEIATNTITDESMILQSAGITVLLYPDRGISVRLRDGAIYGDRNWVSDLLKEDKIIQESYLLNSAKIVENGRILVLPDKTQIYLESENKIIIRLKSKILIVKDNNDGSIAVKLSDGYLMKLKGREWATYPVLAGQGYKSLGIRYPFINS